MHWPIAAFPGRSAGPVAAENVQQGRYTLLARGPERDEPQIIGAVGAARPATDLVA